MQEPNVGEQSTSSTGVATQMRCATRHCAHGETATHCLGVGHDFDDRAARRLQCGIVPQAVLNVSFDRTIGRNNLARKLSCSPRHIVNLRAVANEAILSHQEHLVAGILQSFTEALATTIPQLLDQREVQIVSYAMESTRWEETDQRVFLKVAGHPHTDHEASCWHVMVQRHTCLSASSCRTRLATCMSVACACRRSAHFFPMSGLTACCL